MSHFPVDRSDITESRHGGNPESQEAFESVKADSSSLRKRIWTFIHARGQEGATVDEIESASGLRHQTVSARVSELKAMKLLVPSGERRKTSSGRFAAVLVVKK